MKKILETPELSRWMERSRSARKGITEIENQIKKDFGVIKNFEKLERLQSEYRYSERMCWHFAYANIPNESPNVFNK